MIRRQIYFSIEPEFQVLDKYYSVANERIELEAECSRPYPSALSPSTIVSTYSETIAKCHKRLKQTLCTYGHHVCKRDIIKIHQYLDQKEIDYLKFVKKFEEIPFYQEDGNIDTEEELRQETTRLKQYASNFYCRCRSERLWLQVWQTLPILISVISLLVAILK